MYLLSVNQVMPKDKLVALILFIDYIHMQLGIITIHYSVLFCFLSTV